MAEENNINNSFTFGKIIHNIKQGQKRKLDEDEIMDISENNNTPQIEQQHYFQIKKVKSSQLSSQDEHDRILSSIQQMQQKQEQIRKEEEEQRKLKPKVENILNSLEKDQIIDIINSLLDKNPKLGNEILSILPRPTLKSVTVQLQNAEKKMFSSFPYTKWGADRSDYSFNRVKQNLMELLELAMHYLKYFTSPENYGNELEREYPVSAMGYLDIVTQLAFRLPVWNQAYHNEITREVLFKELEKAWQFVINELGKRVQNGKVYSSSLVGEWLKSLIKFNNESNGNFGFTNALKLFKEQLGWLIGLYPSIGDTFINQSQFLTTSFASHPLNYSNVTGLIDFRT